MPSDSPLIDIFVAKKFSLLRYQELSDKYTLALIIPKKNRKLLNKYKDIIWRRILHLQQEQVYLLVTIFIIKISLKICTFMPQDSLF